MSNENPTLSCFQLGELVLARSPTLPFWPAFIQVCEAKDDELEGKWRTQLSDGTDSRYWCVFVNTKDCASWVSVALVKKFTLAEGDASVSQCRAANMKEKLTTAIQQAIELREASAEKRVTALLKPIQTSPEKSNGDQETSSAPSTSANSTNAPEPTTNSSDIPKLGSSNTGEQGNDVHVAEKKNDSDVIAEQSNALEGISKVAADIEYTKSAPDVVSAAGNIENASKPPDEVSSRVEAIENPVEAKRDIDRRAHNVPSSQPRVEEKENPPDSVKEVGAASPVTTRSRTGALYSSSPTPTSLVHGTTSSVGREISSVRHVLPLPGDLVLAKTGTYPYWPAIVSRCESEKKNWNDQWVLVATKKRPLRVWVTFVGDTTGGWVPLDKVRPYNPQHAEEFLKSQNARMYKDQKQAIALANEMHDSKKRLKTYPNTTPTSTSEMEKVNVPHAKNVESNNQEGNGMMSPKKVTMDVDLKYRLGDIVLAKYDHSCPYWPAVIEKCSDVKEEEGEDKSLLGKWHRKAVGNISDRYCCLFINDGSESWVTVEIIVPFTVHRAKRFLLNKSNELYEPQRVAIDQAAVMHKKRGNFSADFEWTESDVVLAAFQNAFWPAVIKKCGESEDSSHGQWKKTDDQGQPVYWCAFLLNSAFEWVPAASIKPFTAARARHYFVSKQSKYFKYQKDAISLATKLMEGKVFGDDVIDAEDELNHNDGNSLPENAAAHEDRTQGQAESGVSDQVAASRNGNSTTEEGESYVQYGIVLVRINHTTYWPARIEPCPDDPDRRWTLPDDSTNSSKFWCNLLNHSTSKWTIEQELKPFKPHRARRYMYRKTSPEIYAQRQAVKMATELQKKPEAYKKMFNIPAPIKEQIAEKEIPAAVTDSQNVSEKLSNESGEEKAELKDPDSVRVSRACVSTDPQIKELLMAKVATEKEGAFKAFENRKRPAVSNGDTLLGSPPVKQIRNSLENLTAVQQPSEARKSIDTGIESTRGSSLHIGSTVDKPESKQTTADSSNIEAQTEKETERTVRDSGNSNGKRMRVEVVVASGSVKKRK